MTHEITHSSVSHNIQKKKKKPTISVTELRGVDASVLPKPRRARRVLYGVIIAPFRDVYDGQRGCSL